MKKLGPVAAKKNQDKSCLENQDEDKSVVVTSWFKNKRVLLNILLGNNLWVSVNDVTIN